MKPINHTRSAEVLIRGRKHYRLPATLILTFLFLLASCTKDDPEPQPPLTNRPLEVWLHRVNTVEKALKYQYKYSGFELDVHYDEETSALLVKHDFGDTTRLTLRDWFRGLAAPASLGYWFDMKNLSASNASAIYHAMKEIRNRFGLYWRPLIIESSDPASLPVFDTLNFRISYYIPTFNPASLTPEEEQAYKTFIDAAIASSETSTISGYSMQHDFMKTWYPGMNKLLWFLDSFDPEIKNDVIKATAKDPTVEVLLVAEEQLLQK